MLTVVHVDGSKRGQTETFTQDVIGVGRDPSNPLAFDPFKDTDVSARHAQFMVQGGQLLIQDLNSRNGTLLNGVRVGSAPTPVEDGAVVQFGDKGPKVQVSFRVAPTGPGKKTMMIQDLQTQLDGQKEAADKAKAGAKSSKVLSCVAVVLILGLGAGGFVGWQWYSKRTETRNAMQASIDKLPDARKAAEAARAEQFAKAELDKARAAEKDADSAREAGKTKEAADLYAAALVAYADAARRAEKAETEQRFAALAKANEDLLKKVNEKKEQQQQQTDVRQKELDEKKAQEARENEQKVAQLKAELEAAKTTAALQPLIEAALASTKPQQLEQALGKVQEGLKTGPNEQLTKWQGQLQGRLDEVKALPAKLDQVATAAKPKVVSIVATSYMLPRGQTEKTTAIREFLTTVTGTGFYVAKDKVVTAKELVEPWKYDPAALALKKKYEENYGYQVSTRVDVQTLDTAGIYTTTSTTNLELEAPTAKVIYAGADAFADKPVDQTIKFKGADVTVPVQPHKRDVSNVAVIQLTNGNGTPIALAKEESLKPGTLVIALGQRVDANQAKLWSQQAEVSRGLPAPALGTGAFATWAGGPVLSGDGELLGAIIEVGKDEMRLVPPSRVKEAAGLN